MAWVCYHHGMAREREGNRSEAEKLAKNRNEFLRFIPSFLTAFVGGVALADINPLQRVNIWEREMPSPDPDAYRFLLIADVHGGSFDNGARQNNSKSLATLKNVVNHLKDYPFDRAIQMGDLIRREKELISQTSKRVFKFLVNYPSP